MDVPAIYVVLCCIIAEKTQIQKIGGERQEFERGKISFVERSGIGPYPANAILFQKPDKLRPMPSSVTKFNRETKIPWKLFKKFTQHQPAILWRKGRRKLDKDNLQL